MRDEQFYIAQLEAALEAYGRAADKFIRKVDQGLAHSHETYRDLVEARAKSMKVQGET